SRVGSYETFRSSIDRPLLPLAAFPAELPLSQPAISASASARNAEIDFMAIILSTPVRNSKYGSAGGSVRRDRVQRSGGRDRVTPRRQHDDPCHRLPAYTDNSRSRTFAGASPCESLRLYIRYRHDRVNSKLNKRM